MAIFYKYCNQQGIEILKSRELILPFISKVNDPLDCRSVLFCPNNLRQIRKQCLISLQRNGVKIPGNFELLLRQKARGRIIQKMLID